MLPDVQTLEPEIPIGLSRVGARGIKKLVQVKREGKRPIILISTFDVFVNLPSSRKGVNLSRNFEAVDEVIERITWEPVENVEDLVLRMTDELLERHEYADEAEVRMRAELIMRKRTPASEIKTQEVVNIFCNAKKRRNGEEKVMVGVEVYGITVCPCAQELVRANTVRRLEKILSEEELSEVVKLIPFASHNQRGRALIMIESRKEFRPRIEDLIRIAKSSMSYEVFEILKRSDELEVVEKAHFKPMFVEDSVRQMAKALVETFKDAPDDAEVYLRQLNEESIHQHDVIAERRATIGELRKELGA